MNAYATLWNNHRGRLRRAASKRATTKRTTTKPRLALEALEPRRVMASFVAVGADAGGVAEVRIFADPDQDGQYLYMADRAQPYGDFAGGLRVAMGDVDGDGNDELVVAAGPGGGPRVTIFDLSSEGKIGAAIDDFFAYGDFTGGVFIAAGDIDGDGKDELITSPDAGGAPRVQIFSDTDQDGRLSDNLVDSFFAFNPGFLGGVRVAVGNVDGRRGGGGDDLIVAAGPGGGPHVKMFSDSDRDLQVSDQPVSDEFFAFGADFRRGVYVATARLEGFGSNGDEIIVGAGAGGSPLVRIFTDVDNDGDVSDHPVAEQFLAYGAGFGGGVRVAGGNSDPSDAADELIVGPGASGGPHIKFFDDDGDASNLVGDNALGGQFFAYDVSMTRGVFVAFGQVRSAVATSNHGIQPIPDAGGGPLNSTIFVPVEVGIIRDLDVSLFIDHEFNADLDVKLTHVASGVSIELFTDVGGSQNGFYVRLDDEAKDDISKAPEGDTLAPIVGRWRPENPATLSVFDGLDASGAWVLTIEDDLAIYDGLLLGWTLHFTV